MRRRKKSRADGGFVLLSRQVTRSAAFCSLSPRAVALLVALMDHYEGQDNRVPMSRDEAVAWLKSGTHQAAQAFAELEAKGFVRCHERGGFTRKVAHATTWTLTMYGRGGQKATLDFLSWHSDGTSKNKTRVPIRHKYGCQYDTRDGATGANTAPARHVSRVPIRHKCGCQYGTAYRIYHTGEGSECRHRSPPHFPDRKLGLPCARAAFAYKVACTCALPCR
jgi:hypothetical protein